MPQIFRPVKKWPFPGESPLVRARKMCLAYRHHARQIEAAKKDLLEALTAIDRRLISFSDPNTLAALTRVQKTLEELPTTKELDDRFTDWGVDWHAEQPDHYDMNDYVKPRIAAQLIHVAEKTIGTLRIRGKLKGHWDETIGHSGGYRYRVADVYAVAATMPGKGHRSGKRPPQIPSTTAGEVTENAPHREPQ